MDDIQGILNAMIRERALAADRRGRDRGHRPQHPLRLHRPAQHRPVGFMLLGAYGFAISITQGLPLLVAILVGLVAAGVFALVLGVPTLKLRGDYLAIVTISAAEIVRYVGSRRDGVHRVPRASPAASTAGPSRTCPSSAAAPPARSTTPTWRRRVGPGAGWIASSWHRCRLHAGRRGAARRSGLVVILVCSSSLRYQPDTGVNGWWVRRRLVLVASAHRRPAGPQPLGASLRGVREDEDAMRSLGKNVFAIKMQALVIGGLFGAIGGMLYVLPRPCSPTRWAAR